MSPSFDTALVVLSLLSLVPVAVVLVYTLVVALLMSSPAQAAKARHSHVPVSSPSKGSGHQPASQLSPSQPSSQPSPQQTTPAALHMEKPSTTEDHGGAGAAAPPTAEALAGTAKMDVEAASQQKEEPHAPAHADKSEQAFASEPRQSISQDTHSHVGHIPASPEQHPEIDTTLPETKAPPGTTAGAAKPDTGTSTDAVQSAALGGLAVGLAAGAVPTTAEMLAHAAATSTPGAYLTADAFFGTLARLKAETFAIEGEPADVPIWVCNRDDKVIDVIQGLIRRKVHAVPVLYKSTGKYMGFLDWMDVLRYVLSHFGKTKFEVERSFWDLVEEEKEFSEKTVDDLMQHQMPNSLRNVFHPIVAGYSAFGVVEAMARERSLHRVPILSNSVDRHLINLVTQSQCIRWLSANRHLLGDKMRKPIALCAQFFKPVLSVTEDSVAIDAFQTMSDRQVQGLAVVDASGRLRGNISVRDLKVIGADAALFWRLTQTVKNFVRKVHNDYRMRQGRPRSVVFVVPQDTNGKLATLDTVISTFVAHDIHRIYVCDSHAERKPIGVISLRDILLECVV